MKHFLELPNGDKLEIRYNRKVYSPAHSAVDTIVIADRLIKMADFPLKVLDAACGSGVIGLALKHLNPQIDMTLTDISVDAVRCAADNADRLGLDVAVYPMDMTQGRWDMVTTNLPSYDHRQKELPRYGPKLAYEGGRDGLDLFRRLFKEVNCQILVCECQTKHQEQVIELAKDHGWKTLVETDYSFAFRRSR